MQKFKIEFLLLLISVLLNLNCPRISENYSILKSSPYVDYGTNVIPEIIDGPIGKGYGFGGNYVYTATDADTSIGVTALHGLIRKRIRRTVELGFTGSLIYKEKIFPYGIFDIKFQSLKEPISICPDFAIGAGLGREKWSFDFRFSTMFGYPILRNQVNLYLVPKIIFFTYAYHYEEAEGGSISVDYAISTIYGFGTGLCFSLPLGTENRNIVPKLKIKPEFNYLMGREPKLDQINFSVLQIGLQVLYAY